MRAALFRLAYRIKRPIAIRRYDQFVREATLPLAELRARQDAELRALIRHSVAHVPHYTRLFRRLGLAADDIRGAQDLDRLPLLTKDVIRADPESFVARVKTPYVLDTTGGSTGAPLRYRVSIECYSRGVALLFRGWGFAGYRLGDRMSTIAGASLVSTAPSVRRWVQDQLMNVRHYSSYGISEADLAGYVEHLRRWRPRFLRGYASSLYLLAKYIESERIRLVVPPRGIFSTAEVLHTGQRQTIERVFRAPVFDNYGLNDGGVSAYECHLHAGFHIDLERAMLQTVDDAGTSVNGRPGAIVATSLHNYAMPFIRYATGDLGVVSEDRCPCGCERPLLKELSGRTTDYLRLNGRLIGSPQLTVLMGKVDVEQYQIVQTGPDSVQVRYIPGREFKDADKDLIRGSLQIHVGSIRVQFEQLDLQDRQEINKHRFIINEVCR